MPCKSSRNNRRHTRPSARPAVGIITAPNPSAGTHTRGPRAHAPDSATDIRTRAPREAPCARRGLWDTRPAPGRRPPWHLCVQGPTRHDHGTTTARPRRDHGALSTRYDHGTRHNTTTVHGTLATARYDHDQGTVDNQKTAGGHARAGRRRWTTTTTATGSRLRASSSPRKARCCRGRPVSGLEQRVCGRKEEWERGTE